MTIINQETHDRARANSDALFKQPPCAVADKDHVSCLAKQNHEGKAIWAYTVNRATMCLACRAYWYAEMCALTLEGRV